MSLSGVFTEAGVLLGLEEKVKAEGKCTWRLGQVELLRPLGGPDFNMRDGANGGVCGVVFLIRLGFLP
jgi:hypothetical protein